MSSGKILIVAPEVDIEPIAKKWAENIVIDYIKTEDEFEEKFETLEDGSYNIVICGCKQGEAFALEVGQVLSAQMPSTKILYISQERASFNRKNAIKNGFSEAFLFPIDANRFEETLATNLSEEALSKKLYKPIKVIDLDGETKLDFDTYVFLPLNKKYVHFSAADAPIGTERVQKLKDKKLNSMYIDQKNLENFYEYTAERLQSLGTNDELSATEKEEKLQKSISTLFSNLFDETETSTFDSGKETLAHCQKIVSNYITKGSSSNWYSKILSAMGGKLGAYEHATGTSTFAALFAIGLGHSAPEDLALAGFFHDVALADFPEDLLEQPESKWPKEMKDSYEKHPQNAINIVKSKKIIISDEVQNAIAQHHERFDGKGFPKQLYGEYIKEEAQILSFADQFQELTVVEEGKKSLKPMEAAEAIEKNGSIGVDLVKRIKKLLVADA